MHEAKNSGSLEVPIHLKNAPTKLMSELGYGANYRYAHNEKHGYAAEENYLPEEIRGSQYYTPTERGLEKKIKEKLDFLKKLKKE
jgi:putative ATPase